MMIKFGKKIGKRVHLKRNTKEPLFLNMMKAECLCLKPIFKVKKDNDMMVKIQDCEKVTCEKCLQIMDIVFEPDI